MRKSAPGMAALFSAKAAILMATIFFALAVTSYADAPTAPPDQGSSATLSETELPFTTPIFGKPIVSFKANEWADLKLAIDTGSTDNVISESFAKKLGLQPEPFLIKGHPYLLGGKPASYVSLTSLQAGSYSVSGIEFLVADDKYLSDFKPYSVEGILGLGTLCANAVFIDYGRNVIAFMDSHSLTQQTIAALGFGPNPVAITDSPDKLFQVPVTLTNGSYTATEEMEIDTGAPNTTISRHDADQLHVKTMGQSEQGGPFLGNVAVSSIKLDKIAVGDFMLSGGTFLSYRKDGGEAVPDLGVDILSECRALFDFPANKMYIEPAHSDTVAPAK